MADFSEITQEINEQITTNGQRAITGAKLNTVLRDMMSSIDEEKMDVVEIDTVPTEGSTNPVESGGVYDALGNLYNALAVAENCLFGGYVEPNDEPIYGDDHRYYYLAATEGRYTHFYNFVVDGYIAMFSWSESTQNWRMLYLWPNDQIVSRWLQSKANIVYNATDGNLAGLDEEGNLTDSGIASSEVATQSDISGFITNTVNNLTNYYLKSETYTQAEINALIGAIQQFHYEIYATLPQTGQSNVLYLIGPTGSGSDKYEEYVYSNSVFTKIGDTSIDLSGYVTTSALNTALSAYTTTSDLTTLLSNKADKVQNAVSGNFAGLDATGNLTDSGKSVSDFATATQGALADTAYQKPLTGIPASDLASGVIPTVPVQDVTVGGTSVVSNGTAVIPQEVFWVTYGSTNAQTILYANSSGKLCVCMYYYTLYLINYIDSNYIYFTNARDNVIKYVRIYRGNNTWSNGSTALAKSSDKVSTILGNETNETKYPNTKAVADALSDYVQKSQTVGLLKNDGTVDTTQYGTYSKPSGGIPASDLASGVIPSIPVQDVTVGGISVLSNGVAVVPSIPDVSGKADKILVDTSMPVGGFLPNVVYNLGVLSGNTSFTMAAATDNTIANIWCWTFTTPSTAPTITWPSGITSWSGGIAPTINASKSYEVSVMSGLACIVES